MMEENKNMQEKAMEMAKEGAKMAGKAAKGTAKAAGKVAGAGAAAAGSSLLMPILIGIGSLAVLGGLVLGAVKFFTRDPLTIDKTANVVEEVKKIGEFTSAVYYEEVVLQDSYTDSATFMGRDASALAGKATKKLGMGFMSGLASKTTAAVANTSNEIVLIGKGRVRAGFDLAKLGEDDFNVHGDTLEMVLPQAEVFDIIMNPSDFTTEYEKGTWSHELTKPLKERAKQQLEQNALDYGILKKAEESGLKRLTALFQTFGFTTVTLSVRQPEPAAEPAAAEPAEAATEPAEAAAAEGDSTATAA